MGKSKVDKSRFAIEPGARPKVLGVVLAGGEGRRLAPLTTHRAKPAVPFGGNYRIIDFVLSNFVNSGIHRVKVLTQYKSDSLLSHLARNWQLSSIVGQYIEPVPAQQRLGKQWFRGSADALFQSFNVVDDEGPDFVCVFGGDHIYKMDVRQMLASHIQHDAHVTVAAIPVPLEEAKSFGVLSVDDRGMMLGFEEKPQAPRAMPTRPGWALVSMGNYIFDRDVLHDVLSADHEDRESVHDFGRNVLPRLLETQRVHVYDFLNNEIPGTGCKERGYWRDVGTIEAYYEANMDLASVDPVLNLYNQRWPIRGAVSSQPPAKFVFADEEGERRGIATDSLVSHGCIISGGRLERSLLFPGVRINSYSVVQSSILMDGVDVGRHCRIKRAVIDKGVAVPPKSEIGFDLEADRKRFHVSETGIVIVPKGYTFVGGAKER